MPPQILPAIVSHLDSLDAAPNTWLFPGEHGMPIYGLTLNRAWNKARASIGRPDLRLHDLRHSGLTWSAATGASVAELMKRGGHASPTAALRYQHATMDRDRALANALAEMATGPAVVSLVPTERVTDEIRTKLPESDGVEATILPLTCDDPEQSQRGSNPCSHLERVVS